MSKDLFSGHADSYSRYRPGYPAALVEELLKYCKGRNNAWDCATGNGQMASLLSGYFKTVYATDISNRQLAHAIEKPNIIYTQQPAEETSFPDDYFDLVTVAQAYHWFNFSLFERELKRVCRDNAVIAIIGYGLFSCSDERIDALVDHFYQHIVGSYWQPERKFLDEAYTTIPFNYGAVVDKIFHTTLSWTIEDLAGYLRTWSSVQDYIKANGSDPVDRFTSSLQQYWEPGEQRSISFPLFLKIGSIIK